MALLTDQEILDIITIEPNRGYRLLMTQYQEQLYWHIRNIVTWHEDADDVMWEAQPLGDLAKDKQIVAFKHNGFWKCMDTLRDKNDLEDMWNSNPKWKVWE